MMQWPRTLRNAFLWLLLRVKIMNKSITTIQTSLAPVSVTRLSVSNLKELLNKYLYYVNGTKY